MMSLLSHFIWGLPSVGPETEPILAVLKNRRASEYTVDYRFPLTLKLRNINFASKKADN